VSAVLDSCSVLWDLGEEDSILVLPLTLAHLVLIGAVVSLIVGLRVLLLAVHVLLLVRISGRHVAPLTCSHPLPMLGVGLGIP
jgi:hypothetical protein